MPLGLDAPTSIGMALLVLGPAFIAFKQQDMDPHAAGIATWQLGMAALVIMGVLKFVLSFFGEAVTRALPRAALLGSIAGIALVLMGLLPLLETLRSPLVGFTTLGLLLYVLIAKGKLPVRGPGVLLAFVFGTVLYYGLGLAGLGSPHCQGVLALTDDDLAAFVRVVTNFSGMGGEDDDADALAHAWAVLCAMPNGDSEGFSRGGRRR